LRENRALLMRERLAARSAMAGAAEGALDLEELFPGVGDVWLEIGFGAGEHVVVQALANPDTGILACEHYLNGVAACLAKLEAEGLDNVRLHNGDARDLMDALPDAAIGRVFLLYPDPWPKARHHKRRFISPENLDAFSRIMRAGAHLRVASDIPDYIEWTLEHLAARDDFTLIGDPEGGFRALSDFRADRPMIRPELVAAARRWAEPVLAAAATLAALWIAGASTLRWGWLTLVLSAIILLAGGLWLREAVRRVRLSAAREGSGQVFVEERRVLYIGRFGNVQVDLDDVTRIDLATFTPGGAVTGAIAGGGVPAVANRQASASVMLFSPGSPPVTVPLDAEGEDGFLDALCSLPGFRLDDLSGGLAATQPIVTIWRRA